MNISLCCIVKLENHYIKEFIEHYKNIGFSHIFIYDNNDIDGEKVKDVINDYIDSGFVSVIDDYRGKNGLSQFEAYYNCFEQHKKEYDWMAFFDCDEFLIIDEKFNSISDVLSLPIYENYDAINVCWKNYGDNNIIKVINNDYSVLNRFTHPCENCTEIDMEIKTIARCNESNHITDIHCGNPIFHKCNSSGENVKLINEYNNNIDLPSYENMFLNHYRTKTIQEFIDIRIKRGYDKVYKDRITMDYFFRFNEKTQEKIDFINNY